ncbi:hypothetical protein E1264_35910 [Actinomadura sp. KC216]|uniref:hypothetical protein n=1 Tax=Actinomadura sp. KC216 TaxID=2530370 RepID=UPI001044A4C3|nr:hypothetical protein [Actinomadura sp. KC216]TDB79135.1 hypothetical protein E1264_35910 [Actinomadura sp. KC216]
MRNVKRRTATVISTLALATSGLLATGTPAAHAVTCNVWSDRNTYGATCGNDFAGKLFRAVATCRNGAAYGPWKSASDPTGRNWSYAYCANKGGLKSGDIQVN